MTEHKHTSYRVTQDARNKLQELADLDGITNAQMINNLIQAEHRYRREQIERTKDNKNKVDK